MPLKSMRMPPGGTLLGGPETATPLQPEFPYGLSLELDETSLKLLGIDKLPKVGSVLEIEARVVVKSTSERTQEGEGLKRCVSLQITDMEIEGAKKDASAIVYTEDN